MSVSFNRFVATQALGIAGMNAAINASYTWALWRGLQPLTLFGENAIAFDLASTPAWIAVLSTLLGTASIRAKLRDGRVALPLMRAPNVPQLLPHNIVLRSAVLGGIAAAVFGLLLHLLLKASAMATLSLAGAVGLKVVITVGLSLVLVPVVILAGLADVQQRSRTLGSDSVSSVPAG